MKRFRPLRVRASYRAHPVRRALALVEPAEDIVLEDLDVAEGLDGLRLFTTAFLGGLIFFGTFLA